VSFVSHDKTAALQRMDLVTQRDHKEKIRVAGERVAAEVAVEVEIMASMWEPETYVHVPVDRQEALRHGAAVSTPQEAREALGRLLGNGTVLDNGEGVLRLAGGRARDGS
jgi:hypothetical protein